MPSLMTIPRELRDYICSYVLCARTNEPPRLHDTFEQLIESRRIYKNPRLKSWSRTVLEAPGTAITNAAGLQLVNHQLRSETLDNIRLLSKSATYGLDITILDEILPLTTWTFLPFYTTSLDQINATVRISGSYDMEKEGCGDLRGPYRKFDAYRGFRGGCGAGPAMGWQFYSIFERFIRCGASGDGVLPNEHMHITVKTINIDVETPPGVVSSHFGQPRSGHHGREQTEEKDVLDPLRLARFIQDHLPWLLKDGDHEWFTYAKILFEHVDRIVLKKDGEDLAKYNVAEMLRDAGGFQPKYLTKEDLKKYQDMTWQIRKERGLTVLKD